MTPPPKFTETPQDLLEFYAGRGRINRMARSAGYACVAHDVVYDAAPRSRSSLNLCGNAGFTQLAGNVMHACIKESKSVPRNKLPACSPG